MLRSILLFAALAAVASSATTPNYCKLCSEHVMCLYKGPSSSCVNLKYRTFTQKEKSAILDEHNKIRNLIAAGLVKNGTNSGGQPNMHKLYWDDEIATFAMRLVQQCKFDHDKCHPSADGTVNGQNLLLTYDTTSSLEVVMQGAVQAWFEEVNNYDGRLATKPFRYDAKTFLNTGHYTQLAWAKTTRVGCAFSEYNVSRTDKTRVRLIACNYRSSGNFVGEVAYVGGAPASKCGKKGADKKYKALCK